MKNQYSTPNLRSNGRATPRKEAKEKTYIERLKKEFYDFTGFPDAPTPQIVNIGYLHPIDHPKFVVHFFRTWVDSWDKKLDTFDEGTVAFADAFGKRGFTFEEFKLVLSGKIKEEFYDDYRVFDYLYLTNRAEREYFSAINDKEDEKDNEVWRYIDAIGDAIKEEIPLLRKFFFETKIPLYVRRSDLKKHAYFVAATSSGKSELLKLLFYDLQRRSQKDRSSSLVLLEPHGDLSSEVLRFSLNKGEDRKRTVYLDPFIRDTGIRLLGEDIFDADYTFVINPFDTPCKNSQEVNYLTEQLSNAFFEIIKSEETHQMEAIISACCEALIRQKGSSIVDLKRFMDNNNNDDLIAFGSTIPNEERRELLTNLKGNKNLYIAPTKSGIYFRLQKLLGNKEFRRLLVGSSTVQLGDELEQGKVIICNIPFTLGEESTPAFGKLLIALIKGYVMRRINTPKGQRKPVFAFVDEFQNFTTPSIEKILAQARKYGLHMLLSHQQVGQDMDSDMSRIITGNTALKFAGDNEDESLEFMCKQMGKLVPSDFDRLPKYSMFSYNREYKRAGVGMVRVPDFLVHLRPPYYMGKRELKEFLLYMVHESGYYRKIEPQDLPINQVEHSAPVPEGTKGVYEPKFDEV